MIISAKRIKKLSNREYRESYLREMVTAWVVHQIKSLRQQRKWTQADLGKKAGNKTQSSIGRLESETYGNWNTNTLLELANAFDVALEIRFVSWSKFLDDTDDTSPKAMSVHSYSPFEFNKMSQLQRKYIGELSSQPQTATPPSLYPAMVLNPINEAKNLIQ